MKPQLNHRRWRAQLDLRQHAVSAPESRCFDLFASLSRALQRCPGGTSDNSPAYQRRERGPVRLSPDGTAEWKQTGAAIQASLRDSTVFVRCVGVETPGCFYKSLRDRSLRNLRKALQLAQRFHASSQDVSLTPWL